MIVVGIDCATDPRKVGIALADCDGARCALVGVELGESRESLAGKIASWLPAEGPALLALDAPLGWPASLGPALVQHVAGEPVGQTPNLLFRRGTDRFVKEEIGKQPLDVGADRIARTAHSALRLLADVRQLTGHPIPLAWSPEITDGPAAIEVYPAATLAAHGLPAAGYKTPPDAELRAEIFRGLGERVAIQPELRDLPRSNADALDAVVCVLAGRDFLLGRALTPADPDEAKREGWIWVPGRASRSPATGRR
jgi:predicted RNase H-like nuclease